MAPIVEHDTPVLVVGAGPAGLIAALQLACNGQRCLLIERNLTTTSWPKMDITNCRSMELLKRLGIDEGLRSVGVPQNYSFDVNFSTGFSEGGEMLAKWHLPSPDDWRKRIKEQNDGSMPREPYQRCSQAIFEAWLKPKIQQNPLIETHFGWKFESLVESTTGVRSMATEANGQQHIIHSQYVIGCDGAGSKVRVGIGSQLVGGPVPGAMHLIHFKSRDLSSLHRQGQFWHTFFTNGSVIISQDEQDTWTIHIPVPIGTKADTIDPKTAIYRALGGEKEPLQIDIDEILVASVWRPNIFLADKYTSKNCRIFLSGDSAHQNIPTGGYGMNTAVGDSFDIGWKIAACLAGHGRQSLLDSYEAERRPVAARNIERSGVHHSVHGAYLQWCAASPGVLASSGEDGDSLRQKIIEQVTNHDGENQDHGIELGYRYHGSPVVMGEDLQHEPMWTFRDYQASTFPGARAPHVFLVDGKTSIFDLFGTGNEFTFVDFTTDGAYGNEFKAAADKGQVPIKVIHLPNEPHARRIWERDAVLVRPDDHVAWRLQPGDHAHLSLAEEVLSVTTGQRPSASSLRDKNVSSDHTNGEVFTGTVGNQVHEDVKDLASFQK